MAKYTQTPTSSSPSQNRVTHMYTNNAPRAQRYSRVRHITHAVSSPPPQKGAPLPWHTPPGLLQSFLSTPPAPPPASMSPSTGSFQDTCLLSVPLGIKSFLSHLCQPGKPLLLLGAPPLGSAPPRLLGDLFKVLVITQEISAGRLPSPYLDATSTPTSTLALPRGSCARKAGRAEGRGGGKRGRKVETESEESKK